MQVRTNNHWRHFLYSYEVPEVVLKDKFEHLEPDEVSDGFIKYRDSYYHTSDFMHFEDRHNPLAKNWDGYVGETAFSGIVIRISRDGESYKIGLALS